MSDKFDYEMFNDITEEEHLDIVNTLNEINDKEENSKTYFKIIETENETYNVEIIETTRNNSNFCIDISSRVDPFYYKEEQEIKIANPLCMNVEDYRKLSQEEKDKMSDNYFFIIKNRDII